MIYVENPIASTKKVLKLIKEFSKSCRYEIKTQKSVVFLYPVNEWTERKLRKQFQLQQHLKNKIPRNKFNQEGGVKDSYIENYKTLLKSIIEDLNK